MVVLRLRCVYRSPPAFRLLVSTHLDLQELLELVISTSPRNAASGDRSSALARGHLRTNFPPPLQEPRHLFVDELVEPARLLEPLPCRRVRADGLDPLSQILLPAQQHRITPDRHLVPRVAAVDPVVNPPLTGLPLARHEPNLRQIAHSIRYRRRADLQRLRKLRRGAPALI